MAEGLKGGLRVVTAERTQMEWQTFCLDELIAEDHRARQVWAYVEGLDLSALYDRIRSTEGQAGRPATDPAVLMALWLYATLDGVGSARLLDRLCKTSHAYRWLCGGVGMNYHTLADFRTAAGPLLDDLLSRSVAALVAAEVVDLECLAVDGVRVRASAGSGSFRREARLEELDRLARERVALLRAEMEGDPGAASRRARTRRLAAAEDRVRRLEAAQAACREIEAQRAAEAKRERRKEPKKTKPPRASSTDPQARIMSMADGGFRPAYNVQVKTDPKSRWVIGVDVSNRASDRGGLTPAVEEIERRYGRRPRRLLADGGFDGKADIEALHRSEKGAVTVFCPVPKSKGRPVPAKPQRGEGPGVIAWRERMSTEAAYAVYRQRFATERPHADMRNRGLTRLPVRGLEKVKAVVLWFVHAYNFLQTLRLKAEPTPV